MSERASKLILALCTGAWCSPVCALQGTFTPLGSLPGGGTSSTNSGAIGLLESADCISPDGRAVSGLGRNATGAYGAFAATVQPPFKVYCTAKLNSLGCVPAIAGVGLPSASQSGTFDVVTAQVRNRKPGLFFYVVNGGHASLPIQGGTLCVGPTNIRTTLFDALDVTIGS